MTNIPQSPVFYLLYKFIQIKFLSPVTLLIADNIVAFIAILPLYELSVHALIPHFPIGFVKAQI